MAVAFEVLDFQRVRFSVDPVVSVGAAVVEVLAEVADGDRSESEDEHAAPPFGVSAVGALKLVADLAKMFVPLVIIAAWADQVTLLLLVRLLFLGPVDNQASQL